MARKKFDDQWVRSLRPAAKERKISDGELAGHYVRVTPTGRKSFAAVARTPEGKQVWATLGTSKMLTIEEARVKAIAAIKRIKAGLPAFEAPKVAPETFEQVADRWLRRETTGYRSADEIRRILDVYVLPDWRERPFVEIRRRDIIALLDKIEDEHGQRQAHYMLAVVRRIMRWQAGRDDEYSCPVVPGMSSYKPKQHERKRTLDDDEIRAVWAACSGRFGAIVKLCLLTGQRRDKVAGMLWGALDGDTWAVPAEARQKGTGGFLRLPAAALAIINEQPRTTDPRVFAGFNGWSKCKVALDMASGVTIDKDGVSWTVHDLRRTARSLMSRACVQREHAEQVLGHAIAGVEGVYDRHTYAKEKADALAKLAGLLDRILHPQENVIALRS